MKRGLRFARSRSLLIVMLIFLAILAAVVLLLSENLNSLYQALYQANYYYVLLAVLVYLFGIFIWSLRWHVTLSAVGHSISIKSIYVIILGGIFINNVTPFTYAGGDPISRAFIVKKTHNVPYSCGFATILTDFVVDLPVYVSLLIFGFLISLKQVDVWYFIFMFLIWVAFVIGWSFFFLRVLSSATGTRRMAQFASKVGKVFHRKIKTPNMERDLKRFYYSAAQILKNRRVIFYVVIFTAAIWAVAIARLYVIFQAFSYTPTLPLLFYAITLPALVGLIPVLPGGLGTVDFTKASVFLFFGAPLQIAISVALIDRAITWAFSNLIGVGALSYLGIRHGVTKRPRARRPQ